MAATLPQALTITPVQISLSIEAMAACIAAFANNQPEMLRTMEHFYVLMKEHPQEARELLLKLQSMALANP